MRIIFLLFLIGLTGCIGCGKSIHRIEPMFQPYLDRFIEESKNQEKALDFEDLDLIIEMKPNLTSLSPNMYTLGFCAIGDDGIPNISISKYWWDGLSDLGKEALLFHELGHCTPPFRRHRDEEINGIPLSVMHSIFFSPDIYKANHSQYMHELFWQNDLTHDLKLN